MRETLTWIDPAGLAHLWPYGKPAGCVGLGMAPVQHTSTSTIGIAGSQFQSTRFMKRRITAPLILDGTPAQARQLLRDWAHWLDTTETEGWLQVHTLLGETRQITASYAGGLELTVEQEHFFEAQIAFDCHDPFFYDTAPIALPVGTVTPVSGDVAVWPIWSVTRVDTNPIANGGNYLTLKGPPVADNGYGGAQFGYQLVYTPRAAERTMVCDTRPTSRGFFTSDTFYADPVAAYLAAPQSFTVQPVTAGDDFELVYQIPFDRYSADTPPLGIGQANVVFWARGLNSPWPVADAAAYHTQVAYFPGWLST